MIAFKPCKQIRTIFLTRRFKLKRSSSTLITQFKYFSLLIKSDPRSCSSPSTTCRSKPLPESDSTRRSKPLPESDSTRRPKPLPDSDSSPVTELFESNPPPLPPKQRKLVSSVHSLGSQVSKSPSFSSKGSVYYVQSIPVPRQVFQVEKVEILLNDALPM